MLTATSVRAPQRQTEEPAPSASARPATNAFVVRGVSLDPDRHEVMAGEEPVETPFPMQGAPAYDPDEDPGF